MLLEPLATQQQKRHPHVGTGTRPADEGCPVFFWSLVWQAVDDFAVGQGKLKEVTQVLEAVLDLGDG